MGIFMVHGLVVATWVSRIPAIKTALHLSDAQLGLALLGGAAGAITAIPLCGSMVTRFGSRRLAIQTTFAFCASLIPIPLAPGLLLLAIALFVFGATAGSMDVAMNVQGVAVEKALGERTMSRFHAMYSVGGMIGAAAGGALAHRSIAPLHHFAAAAAAFAILTSVCIPGMMSTPAAPAEHGLALTRIPRTLLAVSAIAFCILLSEGAMSDWTAVYLRQVLHSGPGAAAAGFAVFSAAMASFRLMGDSITGHLGETRTLRTGSLTGAAGILCAALAPSTAIALCGFALAGAGFSVIVPLAFGAGGRIPNIAPGAGIATVTGLGYVGFLIGPPAIGFTSQALNLRFGLGLVVLFCLFAAVLSVLPATPPGPQSGR